jgi:hypothetical protein
MAMTVTDTDAAGPGSGTGEGLIAFLDYLIKKNEMVESTASALRTGCRKVLQIEADWQNVDMRTLDVEGLLLRFRNRYRGDLAERSISNYDQRFRSTVEMYRKWLADDATWRPRPRSGTGAGSPSRSTAVRATKPADHPEALAASSLSVEAAAIPAETTMVTYPLPLRPGVQVRLMLPDDLTPKEAQRVSTFVSALAFEERLAITARTEEA